MRTKHPFRGWIRISIICLLIFFLELSKQILWVTVLHSPKHLWGFIIHPGVYLCVAKSCSSKSYEWLQIYVYFVIEETWSEWLRTRLRPHSSLVIKRTSNSWKFKLAFLQAPFHHCINSPKWGRQDCRQSFKLLAVSEDRKEKGENAAVLLPCSLPWPRPWDSAKNPKPGTHFWCFSYVYLSI